MDIELAGTFLEIVSTGSFVRTSERLNVGQTIVSARMRLLEQQLGRSLFVRNNLLVNGIANVAPMCHRPLQAELFGGADRPIERDPRHDL